MINDQIIARGISDPLVLEGLDFQLAGPKDDKTAKWFHNGIHAAGRSLHIARCRFQSRAGANHCCIAIGAAVCVIRDSLFLNSGHVPLEASTSCKSLSMENCLFLGNAFSRIGLDQPFTEETELKLTHNTFVGPALFSFASGFSTAIASAEAPAAQPEHRSDVPTPPVVRAELGRQCRSAADRPRPRFHPRP
jgi:hypothetical protein